MSYLGADAVTGTVKGQAGDPEAERQIRVVLIGQQLMDPSGRILNPLSASLLANALRNNPQRRQQMYEAAASAEPGRANIWVRSALQRSPDLLTPVSSAPAAAAAPAGGLPVVPLAIGAAALYFMFK